MPTFECNAACKYCFIKGNNMRLDLIQIEEIFSQISNYAFENKISSLRFFWQGGEALLMGKDFFCGVAELSNKYFNTKNIIVNNFLQSNLIAYDKGWNKTLNDFFCSHISTSMDFPNHYRKLKSDTIKDKYFEIWYRNFLELKEYNINAHVISLISLSTLSFSVKEYYEFYTSTLKLNSLQINFPFNGIDPIYNNELNESFYSKLGKFICDLLEYNRLNNNCTIEPFDSISNKIKNKDSIMPCIFSPACASDFISITPNGDISSCDCLSGRSPSFIYGNIFKNDIKTILMSKKREALNSRLKHIIQSDCGQCEYLSLCFGGCPVRSEKDIIIALTKKDKYCKSYKRIFKYLLRDN